MQHRSRRRALLVLHLLIAPLVAATHAAATEPYTENTLRAAPGEAPPPAAIDAIGWLEGRWRAAAFGGTGEESWLPAEDGAMVGVFRHRGADGASFYEILVIRELQGSLLLQLRHFDPALVGWEERTETVDFPLVALAPGRLDFEGMRFVREGSDAMTVFLAVDDGAAEVRFAYERY